jgi:hypothetical protein
MAMLTHDGLIDFRAMLAGTVLPDNCPHLTGG